MSRTRIRISALILGAILVAIFCWQKDVTPRQFATTSSDQIVSLMPYSSEWNLSDSEDAIVILAYLPDEVSKEQMALFKEFAGQYEGKVRFAYLNLTRNHPAGSNAVYVEIFNVSKSPTIILRRKGESDFKTISGPVTQDQLQSFIDSGLKSSP